MIGLQDLLTVIEAQIDDRAQYNNGAGDFDIVIRIKGKADPDRWDGPRIQRLVIDGVEFGNQGGLVRPVIEPLPPIESFTGDYRFLSNFYLCRVYYNDWHWKSAEHAYQAQKTDNPIKQAVIQKAPTPGDAKRLGRAVPLRFDWESVKIRVMEEILEAKFSDIRLRSGLLATGNRELIEGNHWGDRFWGAVNGEGRNELGKALMRLRAKLAAR